MGVKYRLGVLLGIIYFFANIYYHELIGNWIFTNLNGLDSSVYLQNVKLLVGIPLLLIIAIIIYHGFVNKIGKIILPILIINTILAVFSYYYLVILPSESIHFVQYTILAVLIGYWTRNIMYTSVGSLIAATIDEAGQYLIIRPDATEYFDFNDVVLDMVGVGYGILVLAVLFSDRIKTTINWRQFLGFCVAVLSLLVILLLSNIISIGPESTPIWFELVKVEQSTDFWTFKRNGSIYHVLSPVEGVLFLLGFLGLHYIWYRVLNRSITE